jgi:hypothetical protein
MKKKEFLTEAKRKAIIADKEKVIIESFAKMFNRIKRIDENEIGGDNEITTNVRTNGQTPPLYVHFKVTFADTNKDEYSEVVARETLFLGDIVGRLNGPTNKFDYDNNELNLTGYQIVIPVPTGDEGKKLEARYATPEEKKSNY